MLWHRAPLRGTPHSLTVVTQAKRNSRKYYKARKEKAAGHQRRRWRRWYKKRGWLKGRQERRRNVERSPCQVSRGQYTTGEVLDPGRSAIVSSTAHLLLAVASTFIGRVRLCATSRRCGTTETNSRRFEFSGRMPQRKKENVSIVVHCRFRHFETRFQVLLLRGVSRGCGLFNTSKINLSAFSFFFRLAFLQLTRLYPNARQKERDKMFPNFLLPSVSRGWLDTKKKKMK